MPERVGLYLAIYLSRWLSRLASLPLAIREKQSRGKCLVWKWPFVFCWANFSPGDSNLWLCLKERQKGEGGGRAGFSAPPGFGGVITMWAVSVSGMICSD